jgi:hypothetical protein
MPLALPSGGEFVLASVLAFVLPSAGQSTVVQFA